MATLPRSSLIQVARPEPPIPLPERITIALEALGESAREGLLAFCVGVGLSVVHEIFEEEITQLVGPRGRHDPERRGYRHGQEDRQLTLGGRRGAGEKARGRHRAGGEGGRESYGLLPR